MSSCDGLPVVGIIGGGASGIITAACITQHCLGRTVAGYELLEASDALGGIWSSAMYDNACVRNGSTQPVYPWLRANLPTMLMDSPLLPWEPHTNSEGSFPSQAGISEYINRLVDKFEIRSKAATNSACARINEDLSVTLSNGEARGPFSSVVVCCGRNRTPKWPHELVAELKERHGVSSFTHSAQINWKDFGSEFGGGKTILLVGAGSSGRDMVAALVREGASTVIWFDRGERGLGSRAFFGTSTEIIPVKSLHNLGDVLHNTKNNAGDIKCILATGFDTEEAFKAVCGAVGGSHPQSSRIAFVGRCGTVAPLAMLFGDAMRQLDGLGLLPNTREAKEALTIGSEQQTQQQQQPLGPSLLLAAHPNIPGAMPFTAIDERLWLHGHECSDACRIAVEGNGEGYNTAKGDTTSVVNSVCRFHPCVRQHLFEVAEGEIHKDMVEYREVGYEWRLGSRSSAAVQRALSDLEQCQACARIL